MAVSLILIVESLNFFGSTQVKIQRAQETNLSFLPFFLQEVCLLFLIDSIYISRKKNKKKTRGKSKGIVKTPNKYPSSVPLVDYWDSKLMFRW